MQLTELPGYTEDYLQAKAKAEAWQDLAWIGEAETVAGFPVRDLNLIDYTRMQWAGAPLITGAKLDMADILTSLWYLSPSYVPGAPRKQAAFIKSARKKLFPSASPKPGHYPRIIRAVMRRPLKAFKFVRRLRMTANLFRLARTISTIEWAREDLDEYTERQFADAPTSSGQPANGSSPARLFAPAAVLAATAFHRCGIPADRALSMPFPQLFQLLDAGDDSGRPKLVTLTTRVDQHYVRILNRVIKGDMTAEDIAADPASYRYRYAV